MRSMGAASTPCKLESNFRLGIKLEDGEGSRGVPSVPAVKE